MENVGPRGLGLQLEVRMPAIAGASKRKKNFFPGRRFHAGPADKVRSRRLTDFRQVADLSAIRYPFVNLMERLTKFCFEGSAAMKACRAWLASVVLLPVLVGCGSKSTPSEPDAFVKELSNTVAAGDLGGAWNYLPPKYQSDVKSVIHEAAANLDAEVYDKGYALIGKLALLLKSKKDLLLKSEMLGQMPKEQKEKVEANWQSLVDAVEALANSEIKTVDGLKNVDPGEFLSSTGNKLFAIAKTSDPNGRLEKLKTFKATVVKREGDTATLKMEMEGEPAEEKEFKQVEGKWLPKQMVDEWDKGMADAKKNLGALKMPPEKKSQALGLIKTVDSSLDKLLAAPDQAAFNNELGGLMIGAMMGGALLGGGGPPGMPVGPGSGIPGGPIGLPGGAVPGPGVPPGLPGGVPLGTGPAALPSIPPPGGTPAVPALPK
jgi:hypothetical protein